MTNLEVLKKQLENEVVYVENLIKTNPAWTTPTEIGWNAIQRCLGMVNICQVLPDPISFEDVEPLYENAKDAIMEMMEKGVPKIKVEHIHCPVNGWDCPYYSDEKHPCRCTLDNPFEECDDFASMWDEGDDWIDDDWEV